jgi:hypothetical protein
MKECDGLVEPGLRRRGAGGFETYRADVFRSHSTMLLVLRKRRLHERQTQATDPTELFHASSTGEGYMSLTPLIADHKSRKLAVQGQPQPVR